MDIQITSMIMSMLGGLGLFLFGMKLMGDGLELVAGAKLRKMIEKLTTNKYMGALVGLAVTAIIQSSSATTVMLVGFVNAGLMSLTQAVGVIMGANVGTTVTGLIIAINLTAIAPLITFIGVAMMSFINNITCKHFGHVITGFGVLFMGMSIMSTSMEPLAQLPEVTNILTSFKTPFFGVLIGLLFTAIIQSSSASVGILQALGSVGAISLSSAVFVIYGQNIGTCITAILSSIGTSKTAKRTAIVHLLFNVLGSLLFIIVTILFPFTDIIEKFVPGNTMLQISLIHIIFNLVSTAIMLPLSNVLISIAHKIIPGEDPKKEAKRLDFLEERLFTTPPMAISLIMKETQRMAKLAKKNFTISIEALLERNQEKIQEAYENEAVIDFLNGAITEYLIKASSFDLVESDSRKLGHLSKVISDIERIGDHSENICELSQTLIKYKTDFGKTAKQDIKNLSENVYKILDKAIPIYFENKKNKKLIHNIGVMEEAIDSMTDDLKESHIKRLKTGECSAVASTIFMDLLINLERIADHATNIAFAELKRKYKILEQI